MQKKENADGAATLEEKYSAYVDGFRDAEGRLPPMMQLKLEHTSLVVANARKISEGESFDPETARLSLAAALLHDTGRYEQLRRYNTFRDSDSVDHAVFSHDIVRDLGWLEGDPGRDTILQAVLYHNRRDVPEGLDSRTAAVSHTVRDADKLDIFRVLEDRVRNTDWRNDCTAFWNLPTTARPTPAVVAAIRERRPVPYQDISTLADFVLIQVGWMISGLRYATSRRLCAERGHLAFRREFLKELTDDPAVDELCAIAAVEAGADVRCGK